LLEIDPKFDPSPAAIAGLEKAKGLARSIEARIICESILANEIFENEKP
jgi:hypothetical protein